ncbi:MAG: response regulator transcription factor [Chloroflexi bacterium]|nr:response regulator transcription factor [Chloroflexota bacterium]
MIRLLLVEDHQIVREGLRRMLELEGDIRIVGECANGEEALRQTSALAPDVVLTDLKMPGMGGLEFIRRLKAVRPECRALVLTFYDEFLADALQAGAAGYLLKDLQREELVQAVRAVHQGRSPLHLTVDRDRLAALTSAPPGQDVSEQERAVLRLVAQGVPTRDIARQLAYSESTVKRSLRRAMEKLGAHNRAEAVAEAVRRSLI